MPKPKLTTAQPRRSSRTSGPPNRYRDEPKDAIRKKSTRSKPKPRKLTPSKPKRKSKPKTEKITREKSKLNFFGSNSSDDDSVRIVLHDIDPEYTPLLQERPTNRQHQRIGQRVTIPSNKLNPFQLANMRAIQKRQANNIMGEMAELAKKFNNLQTPGFTQRK